MGGSLAVLGVALGLVLSSRVESVERVVPQVAWVRAGADGVGTGFVVDQSRKWLLTCRHVVGGRERVELFFPHQVNGKRVAERAWYLGHRETLRQAGTWGEGRVVRVSETLDLALVELETLPPGVRALPLRKEPVRPGVPVFSLGNRFDLETLWNCATGSVRQRGRLVDGYFWQGRRLATDAPALLLNLPIAAADSGGPVCDTQGRVVGMVSGTRQAADATLAIAAEAMRSFLDVEPIPTQLRAELSETPFTNSYDRLVPATVWVRPTATSQRCAGVIVDRRDRLVLTTASAVRGSRRVAVLFPLQTADGDWQGERDAYADPVELWKRGVWRIGTVVAFVESADLAILQLDALPAFATAIPLAEREPRVGTTVESLSHPFGTEFVWALATGVVRQRGANRTLFQLPAQSRSPGGPIVNSAGELVGILATETGSSQVAYSVSLGQIRRSIPTRGERLFSQLWTFGKQLREPGTVSAYLRAIAALRASGTESETACDRALSLDPDCLPALLLRANRRYAQGQFTLAGVDVDRLLQHVPENRAGRFLQAELWLRQNEPRRAAGELARWLEVEAGDAEARCRLGVAWLAAGEEMKARREFVRAVRLDSTQVQSILTAWLTHVEARIRKYPHATGETADLLAQALLDLVPFLTGGETVARAIMNRNGTDSKRLEHLRALAQKLVPTP